MLYRIDIKNYLLYAIDYFSLEELKSFQYAIVSAAIPTGRRSARVVKIPMLYPDSSLVTVYSETEDYEAFKRGFFQQIRPKETPKGEYNALERQIYLSFMQPILNHVDVMIVCHEHENFIVDALCEYMKEKFALEAIDLNTLFTKGRIGPIYIDRKDIYDAGVPINRYCARLSYEEKMSTPEGRRNMLSLMSTRQKKKHIRALGVKLNGTENLDSLLLDLWSDDDKQGGT